MLASLVCLVKAFLLLSLSKEQRHNISQITSMRPGQAKTFFYTFWCERSLNIEDRTEVMTHHVCNSVAVLVNGPQQLRLVMQFSKQMTQPSTNL